jgi:hypothetical protein
MADRYSARQRHLRDGYSARFTESAPTYTRALHIRYYTTAYLMATAYSRIFH